MGEGREAKKRATRERISDVATVMFVERGFDAVTVDEIAVAAQVSKMTVFNYFARKEDLMLDREDALLLVPFRQALSKRPKGQRPIDTLRALVGELRDEDASLTMVAPETAQWWRVVMASPSLQARLHELEDQAAEGLAHAIATKPDGVTRLAAAMIVLTVRAAREDATRVLERGGSQKKASAAFFALLDRGFTAIDALP